jgi:hypothetical protein
MLDLIKAEWSNMLWLVFVAWFAYDKWGYDVSFLTTMGFFELWAINVKLGLVKLQLEVSLPNH